MSFATKFQLARLLEYASPIHSYPRARVAFDARGFSVVEVDAATLARASWRPLVEVEAALMSLADEGIVERVRDGFWRLTRAGVEMTDAARRKE